jgi:hypothetical protein
MGSFRAGVPVFVQGHGSALTCDVLRRVALDASPAEEWLQAVLAASPALLPVSDVDERVEPPLFSLGREVAVDCGSIDNLFISKNGQLVVVETKLWRNPQARREVVAQVLDYGASLSRWRYSALDELARGSGGDGATSLWQRVQPEGWDEGTWIDRVNTNLAQGRITLLVVGDGIRSEVETLVGKLNEYPSSHFRLGLVEMKIWEHPVAGRIVVPSIVVRTVEVERAVITIHHQAGPATEPGRTAPVVAITASVPDVPKGTGGRLSREGFLRQLRLETQGAERVKVAERLLDAIKAPLVVEWNEKSFAIKTTCSFRPKPLSLLIAEYTGQGRSHVAGLAGQLEEVWGDSPAVKTAASALTLLLQQFKGQPSSSGDHVYFDQLSFDGKESTLVDALVTLVDQIESLAPKSSLGPRTRRRSKPGCHLPCGAVARLPVQWTRDCQSSGTRCARQPPPDHRRSRPRRPRSSSPDNLARAVG